MQVPIGLGGMPGGAMQQAPQYPQRQAIMQGHQMQPGQQAYPMAYQNAGYVMSANTAVPKAFIPICTL